MCQDINQRLISYRMAMSIAKAMKSQGIISESEYHKIDTIMSKKYDVFSSTIFR